jgi:hypothetical protein
MATYGEIRQAVRERHGRRVETCWIAHVKETNGLPMRSAPNRLSPSTRQKPCPAWARPLIEDAMRRLGML